MENTIIMFCTGTIKAILVSNIEWSHYFEKLVKFVFLLLFIANACL